MRTGAAGELFRPDWLLVPALPGSGYSWLAENYISPVIRAALQA
jgi:hypothetical protein